MAFEQKKQKSLHNRVSDYLNSESVKFAVVESEEETVEAIIDELHKAQEDLKAVEERIRHLKWALAKAVP
jgi:hypothetical protein